MFDTLLASGWMAWLLVTVASIAIISLSAVLLSLKLKEHPAARHWVLLSALVCALLTPLAVYGFSATGFSVFEVSVPLAKTDRPTVPSEDRTVSPPDVLEAPTARHTEPAESPDELEDEETVEVPSDADTSLPAEVAVQVPRPEPQLYEEIAEDAAAVPSPPFRKIRTASILSCMWAAGSILLLIGYIRSWIGLSRIRNSAEPLVGVERVMTRVRKMLRVDHLPRAATSSQIRVPIVSGWRSPIILLPQNAARALTTDQLVDVLVHETAHVLRRDQIVLWLQITAKCLLWPLVPIHFLNRELTRAREEICDNYVVQHRDAISYGETLLRMAELARRARPLAAGMGILHWRGELEQRIKAIVSESRSRAVRPQRAFAVAIAACFVVGSSLLCGTTMVAAQQENGEVTPNPDGPKTQPAGALILGRIETAEGGPASNAKVWLVGGSFEEPTTLGETTSDVAGNFAFNDLTDEHTVFMKSGQLCLWAQLGNQLAFISPLHNFRRKPLTLQLEPTTRMSGRLVDDEGQPIAGVTLVPRMRSSARIGSNSRIRYGQFPPALAKAHATVSEANGQFNFGLAPADGAVYFQLESKDFGSPTLFMNADKPALVKLKSTRRVLGKIKLPNELTMPDAGDGKGIGEVSLRTGVTFGVDGEPVKDAADTSYSLSYSHSVSINITGEFECHTVPGQYQAYARFEPNVPLSPIPNTPVVIEANANPKPISLTASRAYQVSGRVIGMADKKPVAGATVQFWNITEGTMRYGAKVETDAEGRFIAHTGKGELRLDVTACPAGYVPHPRQGRSPEKKKLTPTIEIKDDTTWPDLLVESGCDVTLEVIDESGKPAVGAIVKVVSPAGYPEGEMYGTRQTTDADGRYVIRQVSTQDTLPIWVRTAEAISESGLIVIPGELDGPLRVKLATGNGFRFRCKVVDTRGEPVPNAQITIGTSYRYASKWVDGGLALSGGAGSATTNARGVAVTGPLWGDRTYSLTVKADGFDSSESSQTVGGSGIVDLKPFVLSPARRASVTGTVVDKNGKPLAGVRVFGAGDKWARVTTSVSTDGAGKFKLSELAPDVRYVFADKAGFRLGGAKTNRDSIRITLRSNDSSPVGLRKQSFPDRNAQLEAARKLIEQAWALPAHPGITSRIEPLVGMARIDPERAATLSEAAGGNFTYMLQANEAARIVRDDPDRAIELLGKVRKWKAIQTALELGKELAASVDREQRQIALRLADFVIQKSDTDPRVVPLLTTLGEHKKAKQQLERSINLIESKPDPDKSWELEETAISLAPYDFEQAQSLARKAKAGYSRTEAMAGVALAIADTDPDKAIAEVNALTGDGNAPNIRDRHRLLIAMRLVRKDIDRAIELVHSCEEPGNRAQALGWLAVPVAKIDRPRAWKLIDEALAVHRGNNNAYESWSNFGAAGPFAAALAVQAQATDYPDMESVIWHVRAACRSRGAVTEVQRRLRSTIGTARILAIVDKIAARELLNAVADKVDQLPRGRGGVSLYDQWLQAWLIVDFNRGVSLLTEELAELAESGKENAMRYGHGPVFKLLVAEPQERFSVVIEHGTGLWEIDDKLR